MSDLLPPPESEVKPASLTEAIAMPAGGKQLTLWGDVWRKLKRDKRFWVASVMIGIFVLMAIAPALFLTKDPNAVPDRRQRAPDPSKAHWFGTDILGCDYYTRVIYGARTSMEVGLIVVQPDDRDRPHARRGGRIFRWQGRHAHLALRRHLVLRADGARCAPASCRSSAAAGRSIIALVIVMFGWPDMTRLVRSTVISGKQRGYVRAARTMGSRGRRILRRHVLPNGIAPVLVFAAYVVGFSVGARGGPDVPRRGAAPARDLVGAAARRRRHPVPGGCLPHVLAVAVPVLADRRVHPARRVAARRDGPEALRWRWLTPS